MTAITWTSWFGPTAIQNQSGSRSGLTLTATLEASQENLWSNFEHRLASFRKLGKDWDGLGSDAPSPEIVESALDILFIFREREADNPPLRVVASPEGSIVFEWQSAAAERLEAEIREPGVVEYCYKQPGVQAEFWEESFNESDIWEDLWRPMSPAVTTEAA